MIEKTRDIRQLENIARELRVDILTMLHAAKSGHTGGSLSAIDVITALYFYKMNYDPAAPHWPDRDRFVLSKGHCAPALYAALARVGYFPKEDLMGLRKFGHHLQGHPCSKSTPGVEVSTGSLGQGFSQAKGIAMAVRLDQRKCRVYCMLSDGEVQEGMVWEAAMSASHFKLDNLCAILDYNGFQIDGPISDIKQIEPIEDKWKSFGWHVIPINGHHMPSILEALDAAETIKGKPTIIVAKTIKGKGVSIFAGNNKYHGVAPTDEELKIALKELGVKCG